ncbi:MAG: hypothetical protein M0T78_02435 [Actinomycetota bacterium]|nr:hypothetical protein [Actinomycetota bacterium]
MRQGRPYSSGLAAPRLLLPPSTAHLALDFARNTTGDAPFGASPVVSSRDDLLTTL